MSYLHRANILSWFLAFVVFWFGFQEVMHPALWAPLVPPFLGAAKNQLVLVHGILLIVSGLSLVFNFYRRVAAGLLMLMLLDIVIILFVMGGLNDVVVRDIGLFGMAFALFIKN